jgi:hypothetical protein
MSSNRAAALLVSACAALALAACGPTATAAPTSAPSVVAPAPTTSSTGTAGSSGPGSVTGDCGEATAVLIKQHLAARPEVVSVTTEGGCHDALIITTLGPGDALKGRDICDAAAEIAYDGDISSITVLATDTTELSIGIKGQDCIAEL